MLSCMTVIFMALEYYFLCICWFLDDIFLLLVPNSPFHHFSDIWFVIPLYDLFVCPSFCRNVYGRYTLDCASLLLLIYIWLSFNLLIVVYVRE